MTSPASGPSRRRLYGPALVAGLLGATGVTVGASRAWLTATASVPGLPTIHASASGAELSPAAGALGVAMLAAFGAVVATRGWVRRVLGLAVLAAAVVVVNAVLDLGGSADLLAAGLSAKGWSGGNYQSTSTPWRWLVLVSTIVAGGAGAIAAAYGGHWKVMGSRYDAPTSAGLEAPMESDEPSELEVWRALDQGRDPTQES